MKTIGTMIMMLALTLSISGCAKNSGSSSGAQPTGLMSANRVNTASVQMVIYQIAGYGHLPMSALQPLRGVPKEMTSQGDIQSIIGALNHPTGKAFTRMARNNRLAIVGQNGRVVMYGIGGYTIQGCDITAQDSSSKLMPALKAAMARAKLVKLALASSMQSVSYHDAGGTTHPLPVGGQALRELLGQYSPLALKGNRRCAASEIQKQIQSTPRFITIKLAKRDAFDAIVVARESEWPPRTYDTSARLERVKFDTVTIFGEGNGLARFVFADTQSNECLFTDPIRSLRLVKEAQGRNPPVYGPDLFDEAVSLGVRPSIPPGAHRES